MFRKYLIRSIISCCYILASLYTEAQFERILMDEPFATNKRNWPLSSDGNPKSSLFEGRYLVQFKPDNISWKASQQIEGVNWSNLKFEASVYFQSDRTGQNGAGIIFGSIQQGSSYQFLIQPDGKFAFFKNTNGSTVPLKSFTFNAQVRKGINEENRLKAVVQNNAIRLFVNEALVHVEQAVPAGKDFGVSVVNNCDVAFDQLQVSTALTNADNQQLLPDPPKPKPKVEEKTYTYEQGAEGSYNKKIEKEADPLPIAVHFTNKSSKPLYVMVSYVPTTEKVGSNYFVDKYWFTLGKGATGYYFDTYNLIFYFYAEDQTQNFWGNKKVWDGGRRSVYTNGKRYYMREYSIQKDKLVYDANNNRYTFTLDLTNK
ncbi:MAG: hypothetical protein ACN4EP_09035 [Sediminibacterium sp.]